MASTQSSIQSIFRIAGMLFLLRLSCTKPFKSRFLTGAFTIKFDHSRRSNQWRRFAVESRELRFFNSSPILGQRTQNGVRGSESLQINANNESTSSICTSTDHSLEKSHEAQATRLNTLSSSSTNSSLDGPKIQFSNEEKELFSLLREVIHESGISSTLRVAGGWVRDKLLATEEFQRSTRNGKANDIDRLTSKFKGPSSGRMGSKVIGFTPSLNHNSSPLSLVETKDIPVDIDIAIDDMLGREFADRLNDWLSQHGKERITVGVVLKNPEKSKHLETATMKVGKFWIDFVNLRAEEYTEDSRIPDLMRIGTAEEDAYRRDLTINSLFFNINTGQVEDFTRRGIEDLKRGVVATPLPALTTLLDDPLRVLRSVRFAARLRFTIEPELREAAMNENVRIALAQKVARERIGSEVDLMLRSQDPVGAMRLLINLELAPTVFPIQEIIGVNNASIVDQILNDGLNLLSTTHNHLCDCKLNTPVWCEKKRVVNELILINDEEARRRLWYASLLKPFRDYFHKSMMMDNRKMGARQGKKANRSAMIKLMVDHLKRPSRESESIESIMKAADDFTSLINSGCDISATSCLISGIRVVYHDSNDANQSGDLITCYMGRRKINSETEDDPLWRHAMEFRLLVSKVFGRIGPLWRAAMVLSLSEQLVAIEHEELSYTIEGDIFDEIQSEARQGVIQKYDTFAAAILQLGMVGLWSQQPLIDGKELIEKKVLPNIPIGPVFREVMEEQTNWMTTHPGGSRERLIEHLQEVYHEYV